MKKITLVSMVLFVPAAIVYAIGVNVEKLPSCTYCGMDRAKFTHSRILIEYDVRPGKCSRLLR